MWSQNRARKSRKEELFTRKSTFWTWIVDYSTSQVMILLLVSVLPLFLLSGFINNEILPTYGDWYAKSAANDFLHLKHKPRSFDFAKIQKRYQLSWFYLLDANNNIEPKEAFVPEATRAIDHSCVIQEGPDKFFASVTPVNNGYLHAGIPLFKLPDFKAGEWNIFNNLHPGSLVIFSILSCLEIFILIRIIFNLPIERIARRLDYLVPLSKSTFTASQLEEKRDGGWAAADINAIEVQIENLMNNVLQEREVNTAQKNVEKRKWSLNQRPTGEMDLSERSGEQKQLPKNIYQLSTAETSAEFATLACSSIKDLYPKEIKWVAFYSVSQSGQFEFKCAHAMETYTIEAVGKINHSELTELQDRSKIKRSITIGSMQLAKFGLDNLSERLGFSSLVYFPVFRDRVYGLVLVFVDKGYTLGPDQIKVVENFQDNFNGVYIKFTQIEEAEDKEWTDPIAGCGNKTYLNQLFTKLDERVTASGSTFSIFYISAELNKAELAKYPLDFHNHWLREIASIIFNTAGVTRRLVAEQGKSSFLAYLQNNEYCLVLEGAVHLIDQSAEVIRNRIANNTRWFGNAQNLFVTIGSAQAASMIDAKADSNEIFLQAKRACRYAQETYGSNAYCDAANVPLDWHPKETVEMEGSLGVLSAVNLIQSISQAEKTGVLLVVDALGRQFNMKFANGIPFEMQMQELKGKSALIEFVTTFKSGNYKFQQKGVLQQGQAPPTSGGLDFYLLDCALSEDKMNWAQRLLENKDLLLRAIENNEGWMQAYNDADITPEEMEAMKTIYSLCDGTVRISGLSAKTKVLSTALIWRCVGLLHQYRVIETRL